VGSKHAIAPHSYVAIYTTLTVATIGHVPLPLHSALYVLNAPRLATCLGDLGRPTPRIEFIVFVLLVQAPALLSDNELDFILALNIHSLMDQAREISPESIAF
jgi:hypothetical protein